MSYYGFVVTDSGRELIAKLVAGQQLPISKIMVGSGTIKPPAPSTRTVSQDCLRVKNSLETVPRFIVTPCSCAATYGAVGA